jgi:flavin-dependent dehydrogenase
VTQVDATAKARVTASDRADVLVVGASFTSVACAIGAARAGLHVILVERKTDAGEKLHTTGIVVKEAVPIAGDRALLLGDAAGLVSPLTAGGIQTALESGRAAAVAITAALARDTGSAMTVTMCA